MVIEISADNHAEVKKIFSRDNDTMKIKANIVDGSTTNSKLAQF